MLLVLTAAVAGIVAAAAYAPGWDRYRVVATTTGRSFSFTNANAFQFPAAEIAGSVVIMVVLAAAPVLASQIAPGALGAATIAGLAIPQLANVVSGLVQLMQPVRPQTVGLTTAQVAQVKAVLSVSATPWLWTEAVAVGLLILVGLGCLLAMDSNRIRP